MNIAKNKTATIAIAIFLMFSMTTSMMLLQTVNAQATSGTKVTYPVIGATPNPVGVGQQTLILVGITDQLYSDLYKWKGITVTVTRPDGTNETLGPIQTDSTGMTGVQYVPTMVGNYTVQEHFPQQVAPASTSVYTNGTIMLASDSIVITLVVQQTPITFFPGYPLPTEYWTRPVDDQLRGWSSIDGNWLTTPPNFIAYGNDYAPTTAHILWVTPLTSGGQVGGTLNPQFDNTTQVDQSGQSGQVGYGTGDAYEGKWSGSLVMGGKLYYQKYASGDQYKEVICVDLHTGEQLWDKVLLNNLTLSRGQLQYWQTMDYYGVYDYLWATANAGTLSFLGLNSTAGTTWCAFNPFTGDYVYTLYGIPSGTTVYGPHGELLIYTLNQAGGFMTMWNSSNIPTQFASTVWQSMAWAQWRPMGKIINATGPDGVLINPGTGNVAYHSYLTPLGLNGYNWNVTIPKGLPGNVIGAYAQDKIVGGLQNTTDVITWAIDLRPGHEGTLLYNTDWKAPTDWLAGNLTIGSGAISDIDGVRTVNAKESRIRYGFSINTGQYLWTISEPIAMLGHLVGGPSGESGYIAYGLLFCGTMSGVVEAYNVTNGQLVWKDNIVDPHMQVLWSDNWPVGHLIVADGMIYIANLEHSANQPLPQGGPFVCINATTGEIIWRANGLFRQTVWGGRAVMGDSIIATMDTYDQRVYAIGKGPSATTVSIPTSVTTNGNTAVIQGTVMDVSPGTKSTALTLRFANGVPVVSDASMSDWMGYVYKQFTRPTNATGVEVSLDAIDPNGNFIHIGTTTSDASGTFGYAWTTPDISGKYIITATFAGSGAFYGSTAETYAYLSAAPPVTSTATPLSNLATTSDLMTYIVGGVIAIIIAIAIVGLLILRKRPVPIA